jgi:Ca-activated chloride channel family protein
MADGDVLSIDAFSDQARTVLPPVLLTRETRARALQAVASLETGGSTNMFGGIELAERHVAQGPASLVRRIVMISDGQANVGPSSPEALGALAERALPLGAQITSLGVGLEYDERTLDALAVRTSGRLFHVGDPREMTATLQHEVDLLAATAADDASIEIVPASGVTVLGAEGARIERTASGSARIPLGTLFAGQHREALVRVRFAGDRAAADRALASVRLRFRDPAEGGIERVQEVLAHAATSDDPSTVASHVNAKTRAMVVTMEAAKAELDAAQDLGEGRFDRAQEQLARAEASLREEAARTKDADAKRKLDTAATAMGAARATAAEAPKAAPAAARAGALEMNRDAMSGMGY